LSIYEYEKRAKYVWVTFKNIDFDGFVSLERLLYSFVCIDWAKLSFSTLCLKLLFILFFVFVWVLVFYLWFLYELIYFGFLVLYDGFIYFGFCFCCICFISLNINVIFLRSLIKLMNIPFFKARIRNIFRADSNIWRFKNSFDKNY